MGIPGPKVECTSLLGRSDVAMDLMERSIPDRTRADDLAIGRALTFERRRISACAAERAIAPRIPFRGDATRGLMADAEIVARAIDSAHQPDRTCGVVHDLRVGEMRRRLGAV